MALTDGRASGVWTWRGKKVDELTDAENTVLFFEADSGSPLAGGPELLPNTPRFFDGYLIAFADGTVATVPPSEIRFLIWRP